MRPKVFCACLALVSVVLLSAAGFGQSKEQFTVRIPFSYNVGKEVLPPGTYRFEVTRSAGAPSLGYLVSIRDDHGKVVQTFLTSTRSSLPMGAKDNRLLFRNYKGQRFLASLEAKGYRMGLQRSKTENDIVRAMRDTKVETVSQPSE